MHSALRIGKNQPNTRRASSSVSTTATVPHTVSQRVGLKPTRSYIWSKLTLREAKIKQEAGCRRAQQDVQRRDRLPAPGGPWEQEESDDAEQPRAEPEKQPGIERKNRQGKNMVEGGEYPERGHQVTPRAGQLPRRDDAFIGHRAGRSNLVSVHAINREFNSVSFRAPAQQLHTGSVLRRGNGSAWAFSSRHCDARGRFGRPSGQPHHSA